MVEKIVGGKKMGELFMRFCNSYTTESEEFAEEVTNDHPTLQQTAFRTMLACIEKWSKKKYFDLRNEGTVKACKKIVEALGEDGVYLPFV